MLEKEAGLAILNEVGHLIAVPPYARESEGEGFDEDEAIRFEIAGHTEHVTHIVIFRFLVEWYLAYKVIAIFWIVYWVLLGTDDI